MSAEEKPKRTSILSQFGLPDISIGGGGESSSDKPKYEQLKDGTEAAIAETKELAKDINAKIANVQKDTAAKVEEGIALKATLQDKDVPLQVKAIKTLEFLKGPLLGCIGYIWRLFCCLLPYYEKLFDYGFKFYAWAPKNVIQMVFGVVLCFFGGTYVASLAAIEAFRTMGGERLWDDVVFVYRELKVINAAHEKDEAEAAADPNDDKLTAAELIEQSKYAELMQRKIFLGMQIIKEPKRLENAIGSLWSAYVAVMATLSLQFAQIIAIALGMAQTIKPLFERVFTPILEYVLDPSLHHWIAAIISSSLNLIAMLVAWWVIAVVASVYSGLRGGRMFAIALMGLVIEQGYIAKIPDGCPAWLRDRVESWFEEEKDEKTGKVTGYKGYLDEIIGYTLAAIGIYTQISSGFDIFFPLNLVLFPLTFLEWWLRIQVTANAIGG